MIHFRWSAKRFEGGQAEVHLGDCGDGRRGALQSVLERELATLAVVCAQLPLLLRMGRMAGGRRSPSPPQLTGAMADPAPL